MIENFNIGDIWKIITYRGAEHSIEYGEIIEVRDTEDTPVQSEQYRRNVISRSKYLITFRNLRTGEYRSYYHNFIFGHKLSRLERGLLTVKRLFGYED